MKQAVKATRYMYFSHTMTESIQNAKERCTDLTDHALVDPGSASPRMRCIGGRASSGNSQGICELCTRCYDSTSFGFILVSFYFIFPQPSRECHPSTTTTHVCLLDREHPNWSWLRPFMSQPQETRNAHLLVPRGRAGCLHHLALPPVPKAGTLPPSFNGSIHQSLIQGRKIFVFP